MFCVTDEPTHATQELVQELPLGTFGHYLTFVPPPLGTFATG